MTKAVTKARASKASRIARAPEQQTDSHDWLGDAAEGLVCYLAARDGFEVFGAGKWAADAAIRHPTTRRWCRVEVRSTDRPRRPRKKDVAKLAKVADVLAEVRFSKDLQATVAFTYLSKGRPHRAWAPLCNPTRGELADWLRAAR